MLRSGTRCSTSLTREQDALPPSFCCCFTWYTPPPLPAPSHRNGNTNWYMESDAQVSCWLHRANRKGSEVKSRASNGDQTCPSPNKGARVRTQRNRYVWLDQPRIHTGQGVALKGGIASMVRQRAYNERPGEKDCRDLASRRLGLPAHAPTPGPTPGAPGTWALAPLPRPLAPLPRTCRDRQAFQH